VTLADDRRICQEATPPGSSDWIAMIEDDREAWVHGLMTRPGPGEPFGVTDAQARFLEAFPPERVAKLLDVVEAASRAATFDDLMAEENVLPDLERAIGEMKAALAALEEE